MGEGSKTKKHESYESIITSIFKIKGLLNERLNKNSQWLKDINEDSVDYNLDNKYKELIDFANCKQKATFTSQLESLEEAIIAKSIFLIREFQSIEVEIKGIKLAFLSFEDTLEKNEAHERVIERISNTLKLKINTLEKAINDIKVVSNKDLIIELSSN